MALVGGAIALLSVTAALPELPRWCPPSPASPASVAPPSQCRAVRRWAPGRTGDAPTSAAAGASGPGLARLRHPGPCHPRARTRRGRAGLMTVPADHSPPPGEALPRERYRPGLVADRPRRQRPVAPLLALQVQRRLWVLAAASAWPPAPSPGAARPRPGTPSCAPSGPGRPTRCSSGWRPPWLRPHSAVWRPRPPSHRLTEGDPPTQGRT